MCECEEKFSTLVACANNFFSIIMHWRISLFLAHFQIRRKRRLCPFVCLSLQVVFSDRVRKVILVAPYNKVMLLVKRIFNLLWLLSSLVKKIITFRKLLMNFEHETYYFYKIMFFCWIEFLFLIKWASFTNFNTNIIEIF